MSHAMQWYQMSDTGLVAWDKSASDTAPNLRALAYGDGFFTTMGVYDGSLLWQSYHQARLRSHCHALNLSLPTPTSEALWQALQACAANITHGLIKIIISRPTQPVATEQVTEQFQKSLFLRQQKQQSRGWTLEIMSCVDKLPPQFSLNDIYKFGNYLRTRYPNNNNIEAKIRQQLQILRDKGLLQFLGNGRYRKIG